MRVIEIKLIVFLPKYDMMKWQVKIIAKIFSGNENLGQATCIFVA